MNEARVYADGFERSFAEVKDLLEFWQREEEMPNGSESQRIRYGWHHWKRRLKIWMRQMHPWKKFWRIQRRIRSLY